ncbi:pyridoxamine 5'-phosphate oxidase [Crenobacter cavernae]|uniref:Pyridoxine/pyridoxamine 5'-phosphate oxidase n=1 Tax=Crenobacter cavernae TaxID=2290923 RepID=A0ABY0FCI8_9NEIS|nr:pyridoxamine 5'-phosphate oxidase [Crenobacter cavernae]RXZ43825.1 pyridoxamine 5'-phosphate oxidase [Crenobacter cavernae]
MTIDLAAIRQDYAKHELSPEDCLADPVAQFQIWLKEAITAQVNEPTAMNLATVDADGRPSARIVLLKGVEDGRLVFFTNYQSRKGTAITAHPYVAITFFWPELERQVRIEGKAERLAEEASDAYFDSRPYGSRIGAWASEQSREISGKAEIVKRAALFGVKHPLKVPRPPHWGGFAVTPDRVEFWQGRPSRLHDRVVFRKGEGGEWGTVILAP